MDQIKAEVLKQPGVAKLVAKNPELAKELEQAVKAAVRERGIKGGKFWIKAPKNYIDKIVRSGKGKPNAMNDKTGEIIASIFGKAIKPRTILDIGTFSGGTVNAVVNKLPMEQRQLLNVVLVDVAGKTVREHAIPALVALGVPRQNIKLIPASFYSAAVSLGEMKRPLHESKQKLFLNQFKQLVGNVDAITAGAATINFATDLKPYLRSIKSLLKKDGVFVNWDWGSAESMRPTVRSAALKKVPIGFSPEGRMVSHYDAYVSFMNFWLTNAFGYPETVINKFIKDVNVSRKFNSFKWLEENTAWAENERRKIGKRKVAGPLAFRNRAYRTPSAMYRAAVAQGFETERPVFPLAKPGALDTGNVNWMIIMKKK
ncbi:MAG: hypothetical protein NTZ73_02650 [Candidatus Diapherotrites archaeon]|nr:hypothetical protein [Candidatus Diapherotrites archaeon]